MKNYIFYLFFTLFVSGSVFFSTGCDSDPATIPSFVRIDTIIVDSATYPFPGSTASKIDFAWVYINDNLQGVYLLPAKFPVIGEGVKNFRIFAGVYEFGNGSTATRYVFYREWKTTDTLVVQDTLVFQPHVQYDSALVSSVEHFDGFGSTLDHVLNTGGNYIDNYAFGAYDDKSGYMSLDSGDTQNLVVQSSSPIYVPKGSNFGYFIELNYKCNAPFFLDLKTSQGVRPIVGFNTKETWNKAYINVTTAIDNLPGTDVSMVFTIPQGNEVPLKEVYIDNLKLIYK